MGEMEEDEAKQDFLLPPKQEIGRHCNGVKNVIEYRFYGKGEEVKCITTTCTHICIFFLFFFFCNVKIGNFFYKGQ